MITGFNPADMYAADHIRRVLETFPGVFSGIGEFSIHKEFVSGKIPGETASLTNPALDRILDFAGEVGLVVILHCDIDMPFTRGNQLPLYFEQMRDLLARHPQTTIIWAHTGLGRVVQPIPVQAGSASTERHPGHLELMESLLADPRFGHVHFDISWDEVAKYALSSPQSIDRVAAALDRHPGPFPVRHGQCRPGRPSDAPQGLQPVGADLREAPARHQGRGDDGQLRAAVRFGARSRQAMGAFECARLRSPFRIRLLALLGPSLLLTPLQARAQDASVGEEPAAGPAAPAQDRAAIQAEIRLVEARVRRQDPVAGSPSGARRRPAPPRPGGEAALPSQAASEQPPVAVQTAQAEPTRGGVAGFLERQEQSGTLRSARGLYPGRRRRCAS